MALLEVARDAPLQVARLADVEHRALRIEVAVDAGQVRQRRDLGEQALARGVGLGGFASAASAIGGGFVGQHGARSCGVIVRAMSHAAWPRVMRPSDNAACTGTSSAASSTTSATSACAGASRPTWPRARARCACGSTTRRALRLDGAGRRARRRGAALGRRAPSAAPGDVVVEAFGCERAGRLPAPHGRGAARAAAVDQPRVPQRRGLRRAQPPPAVAAVRRRRPPG